MRATLSIFIVALLSTSAIFAQTTGKIAGRITDADTGDPLPSATVVIEGTTRGAAANLDGYYVILNVAPGAYTLRASFVGYGDQVVENVEVASGFTATVDFTLRSGIELEQIVVLAETLIRQDDTGTTTVLSGEDIQALPIQNFGQAVSLTAGTVDAGGLHMRGGRAGEVAYIVDGVRVSDPYAGGLNSLDIPRQSINELQILSGGFNAEYGDAMSGVILVNTPFFVNKAGGSLRVQSDGLSFEGLGEGGPALDYFRPNSNDWGTRVIEGTATLPFLNDKVSLFVNADRFETDTYLSQFDGPVRPAVLPLEDLAGLTFFRTTEDIVDGDGNSVDIGLVRGDVITQEDISNLQASGVDIAKTKAAVSDYMIRHQQGLFNDRTRLTTNLGVKLTRDIDARISYKFTRRDFKGYTHAFKEFPQYSGQNRNQIDLISAQLTHRISPKIFYEGQFSFSKDRVSFFMYERQLDANDPWRHANIFNSFSAIGAFDTEGLSDAEGGNNYDFIGPNNNFVIYSEYPFLLEGDLGEPFQVGRTLDFDGDGTVDVERGTRLTQALLDQFASLSKEDLDRLGLTAGLIPIIAPPTENFFSDRKTEELQGKVDFTAQVNQRNLVRFGAQYQAFNIFAYSIPANSEWDGTLDPSDPETVTRQDADEFYVEASPFKASAYVQDKIEFPNVIVQAGLRLDLINAGVDGILNYDRGGAVRRGDATSTEAKTYSKLSPRLGISFPVTEKAVLSLNIGQFYQNVSFNRMYQSMRLAAWVPGAGYVSEEQFGYDLGFETFVGNTGLRPERTVSYQINGEYEVVEDFKLGGTFFYKDIYDYVSVRRIAGQGGVAYWQLYNDSYANARGFEIRATKRLTNYIGFNANYTYSRAFGNADNYADSYNDWYSNSVNGTIPPRNAQPLDWDQPHTFNVTMNGKYRDFFVGLTGQYSSGLPYTPTTSRGLPLGPKNSARRPYYSAVDARIEYNYQPSPRLRIRPFVEITNLFDKENIFTVYTDTGSAYVTLDPGTQYEDAQRPNRIGPPRHFEFGIEIGF